MNLLNWSHFLQQQQRQQQDSFFSSKSLRRSHFRVDKKRHKRQTTFFATFVLFNIADCFLLLSHQKKVSSICLWREYKLKVPQIVFMIAYIILLNFYFNKYFSWPKVSDDFYMYYACWFLFIFSHESYHGLLNNRVRNNNRPFIF